MLDFLVELVGTFIFLSVIIQSASLGPMGGLAIGLTLASVIYFGGKVSGGHFNPAVTTMFWMDKKVTTTKFMCHVLAQLMGASLAFFFYKAIK
tara:strand:- start:4112 stop:4390 length:279 start_codon:yes stop_codon:yes gene_type:complete